MIEEEIYLLKKIRKIYLLEKKSLVKILLLFSKIPRKSFVCPLSSEKFSENFTKQFKPCLQRNKIIVAFLIKVFFNAMLKSSKN